MRETMKGRGKELEAFNGEAGFECRKHRAASSSSNGGGVCAFCLRDRLAELLCSECGEQRPSSCSCSEISSDPNSNPEIASVGRISFLLENEKAEHPKHKTGEHLFLKRSNSSCVDGGNHKGPFWRIGRMFRKKGGKGGYGGGNCEKNDDSKSEICVSDIIGVPRSRSLCSFRGGGNGGRLSFDTEESGGLIHSAARASSVSGGFTMESAKRSCFSESEARMSNFEARISNFEYEKEMNLRGMLTMREGCEFNSNEDPKFIDLKLDSSDSVLKRPAALMATKEFGFGSRRAGFDPLGSNVRVKKCRKSGKVWRWFFRSSSFNKL